MEYWPIIVTIVTSTVGSGGLWKFFDNRRQKHLAGSAARDQILVKKRIVHFHIDAVGSCTDASAPSEMKSLFLALIELFNAVEGLARCVENKDFKKRDVPDVMNELTQLKECLFLGQGALTHACKKHHIDSNLFKFGERDFCVFFRVLEANMSLEESREFQRLRSESGFGILSDSLVIAS